MTSPRAETCYQLALAVHKEILDLEKTDTGIIQIDEAALCEGLRLRQLKWRKYLNWTVGSSRSAANGAKNQYRPSPENWVVQK